MNQSGRVILVAGSANVDFVVRAEHVPAPGETVLGRELAVFPGGKGANQAVACARAGAASTRMLLAVGEDSFAPLIERSLADAGVQTQLVRVPGRSTGAALICVGDDAQNAITVAPGANRELRASHLPDLSEVGCLLMQLEIPLSTVAELARKARASGVKVILNAAPALDVSRELLDNVDVLIVNEDELAKLSKTRDSIATMLASLNVPCVIVTLGARGCCARDQERHYVQPAFKVHPVDTTAAGDTFCGVLAAALCAHRESLPEALKRASAAAALATTRDGAQSSIPTHEEVEAFLRTGAADSSGVGARDLAAYCGVHP
jgi:ribokinase